MALDAVAPALSHLPADAGFVETAVRWIVHEAAESDAAGRPQGIYRLPGGGLAAVQQNPFSMASFEPEHGVRLVATPAGFASGDLRAHPAWLALAAWLAGPQTQVMHVGAVAFAGRGVLLVGLGGAGKTTSTLACALAGADFLGDDVCVVEVGADPAEPARVYSLYATVKLNADSASRLGAGTWPRLGTTPWNKVVAGLPAGMRVVASAPIAAIVVLAPPGSHPARASELRSAQAVRAIAATGASPASGAMNPTLWFSLATRLVRRAPVMRLALTWDLESLAGAVRRIAEDGARGFRA